MFVSLMRFSLVKDRPATIEGLFRDYYWYTEKNLGLFVQSQELQNIFATNTKNGNLVFF